MWMLRYMKEEKECRMKEVEISACRIELKEKYVKKRKRKIWEITLILKLMLHQQKKTRQAKEKNNWGGLIPVENKRKK